MFLAFVSVKLFSVEDKLPSFELLWHETWSIFFKGKHTDCQAHIYSEVKICTLSAVIDSLLLHTYKPTLQWKGDLSHHSLIINILLSIFYTEEYMDLFIYNHNDDHHRLSSCQWSPQSLTAYNSCLQTDDCTTALVSWLQAKQNTESYKICTVNL